MSISLKFHQTYLEKKNNNIKEPTEIIVIEDEDEIELKEKDSALIENNQLNDKNSNLINDGILDKNDINFNNEGINFNNEGFDQKQIGEIDNAKKICEIDNKLKEEKKSFLIDNKIIKKTGKTVLKSN